jgi:transposase
VKTNRRDSVGFATPPHGGELTAVWVPDESHEAMKDLPPPAPAAGETGGYIHQQISRLMLKQKRVLTRPGPCAP